MISRLGPGHILLFKILSHGSSMGKRAVDFGMGVSSYKKKYAGTEYFVAKGSLRKANLVAQAHRVSQPLKVGASAIYWPHQGIFSGLTEANNGSTGPAFDLAWRKSMTTGVIKRGMHQ